MSAIQEATLGTLPSAGVAERRPVRDRVREVAAIVRREADAIEEQGIVTQAVFDATRDAKLYSIMVPRSDGGDEADFTTFAEAIEEMSAAEVSAGWIYWVLMGMRTGAWMLGGPAIRAAIFDGTEDQMIAGQNGRYCEGVRVPGGYRVTGRYSFASGSRYATWVVGGLTVTENGAPVLNEDGSPQIIHFWVPRKEARFVGNWDVMGLSATESYDYELNDCFVPDEHAVDARALIHNLPCPDANATPFMRLGGMNLGLAGHGAIAAGIARRALEEVVRVTGNVKRMDYPTVVRDHPAFQAEFSEHELKFRGARFNYYHVFAEAERSVADGSPLSAEHQARFRQATSWMHKVAEETVRFAHRWSGTSVIRNPSPLARCIRDVAVATQHLLADPIGMIATAPVIIDTWLEKSPR